MEETRIPADEEVVDGVGLHRDHCRDGEIDGAVGALRRGAVGNAERFDGNIVQKLHLAAGMFSKNTGGEVEVLSWCQVDVEVKAIAHSHDDPVTIVTFGMRIHPRDGRCKRHPEIHGRAESRVFDECGGHSAGRWGRNLSKCDSDPGT